MKAKFLHSNQENYMSLKKNRIMNIKLKEMYDYKNGAFFFHQTNLRKLRASDNFEKIIEYARVEIITFSVLNLILFPLLFTWQRLHLTTDNYLIELLRYHIFLLKIMNLMISQHFQMLLWQAFSCI